MSRDAISGILGITLEQVQALMFEANPDVELPGGSAAAGGVSLSQTVLSDEDMRTLPSLWPTGLELIPDPGENQGIVPFWAMIVFGGALVPYDGIESGTSLEFRSGFGSGTPLTKLNEDGIGGQTISGLLQVGSIVALFVQSDEFQQVADVDRTTALAANVATLWGANPFMGGITLRTSNNDDYTGGDPDNVFNVTVAYSVIDMPVFG